MRAFLRILFLIPIGLMAAITAAIPVYLAAFGFTGNDIWAGPDNNVPVILAPVFVLLVEISRFALLPFLASVVAAEIFAIRSPILWSLFGGAIGLGLQLSAGGAEYSVLPPLAAGLVAGFVYWLCAGHGSGMAPRPTSPAPE